MQKFSPKTIDGLPEAIQSNLDVDAAQDAVDAAIEARLGQLEALIETMSQRLEVLEAVHLGGSLLITYQRVTE
jgi:hypothetical protein